MQKIEFIQQSKLNRSGPQLIFASMMAAVTHVHTIALEKDHLKECAAGTRPGMLVCGDKGQDQNKKEKEFPFTYSFPTHSHRYVSAPFSLALPPSLPLVDGYCTALLHTVMFHRTMGGDDFPVVPRDCRCDSVDVTYVSLNVPWYHLCSAQHSLPFIYFLFFATLVAVLIS